MKKRNPVARNCPKKGGAHIDRKKEAKTNPPRFRIDATGPNRFKLTLIH